MVLKHFFKKTQLSIHLIFAFIAIILGIIVRLSTVEWLFILLSITLVLTLEAVNTAIECVVDLVTSDYHELAKQAKRYCRPLVLWLFQSLH